MTKDQMQSLLDYKILLAKDFGGILSVLVKVKGKPQKKQKIAINAKSLR